MKQKSVPLFSLHIRVKGWIFTSFACTYDLSAKIIWLNLCFNEVERIRIVEQRVFA